MPHASMNRRAFLGAMAAAAAAPAVAQTAPAAAERRAPNILFVMTDQQRADTIAALGNGLIYTPNLDRLVARGAVFPNAYSPCPVCVPARATIRTGREMPVTGVYQNGPPDLAEGQAAGMEDRCGPYLARTLAGRGYRTFGVGKFHTQPWDENLGYEVHLHSEELYGSPDQRARDAYAAFIHREHPEYDFVECLMGERTEMYYMPQMSPLPAPLGVEAWAADRAVEQIARRDDNRPFFGFVSFIGPHPPLAPPIPFNRMYDPDRMANPFRGDPAVDLMDEQIRWMNHAIWAEDINDAHARALRARYYGEISYIDQCLGRILDAVDARDDRDNTLICFFSDHGDHLGDHGAWQKESYFDVSCRIPFLVSWPEKIAPSSASPALVSLTDLFGVATTAAGAPELRDGAEVLGVLDGGAKGRERLFGMYGVPGTPQFKVMCREGGWKHIWMANGGREQLFNLAEDPAETRQRLQDAPEVAARLRLASAARLAENPNSARALDKDGALLALPESERPKQRIYQFDHSRGVRGFPKNPADVLRAPSAG